MRAQVLQISRKIFLIIGLIGGMSGIIPTIFFSDSEAILNNETGAFFYSLSPLLLKIALTLGIIWYLLVTIPQLKIYLEKRREIKNIPLAIEQAKYKIIEDKPTLNPASEKLEAEILQLGYIYLGTVENGLGNILLVFRDSQAETLVYFNSDNLRPDFRTRFEDGFFLETVHVFPTIQSAGLLMHGIRGDISFMHNYHQQQIAKHGQKHGSIQQYWTLEDSLSHSSAYIEYYITHEWSGILNALRNYVFVLGLGISLMVLALAILIANSLPISTLAIIGMGSYLGAELLLRLVPRQLKPIKLEKKRAN